MDFATEDGTRKALGPIEQMLTACVRRAFSRWQEEFAPRLPTVTRRGRRNIFFELIIQEVRETFSGFPGAEIVDTHDNRTLLLYGGYVIRFKRLDAKYRTSNYPTALAVLADTPATLPALPDGRRVTIGYVLDEFETELEGVFAVCFVRRRRPAWQYELGRPDAQDRLPLPTAPAAPPDTPTRRVGPKTEKPQPATGKVIPFGKKK